MRLRLLDYRLSRAPLKVGVCQTDLGACAELVNTAQQRLVFAREAGDEGWYGSWARMKFIVTQTDPFITLPREVARLERITVCRQPVRIQNEFYEFMDFGIGLQPQTGCHGNGCAFLESYDRGNFVTFADLVPPNKLIRVYPTDPADTNRRAFIQGTDQNNVTIYSDDVQGVVKGVFVNLTQPFADTPMIVNELTGIQKDITNGPVSFYEAELATGVQRLLLTMEPGETVAGYRRYYLNGLPRNCCTVPGTTNQVQVEALAKLELLPVVVDTDYLLIQNLEALVWETQAVRHGELDSSEEQRIGDAEHARAIRLLQGELVHRLGKILPAITFAPFGGAKLEYVNAGMM